MAIRKLGDAELEIMQVIWRTEEPVTSTYIQRELLGRRDWALSTLMTTLSRLAEKGYVYCDRSTRTNYYSARVSEQAYKAQEGSSMLEKLYGNSVQNLVACLYDSRSVTMEDLVELRRMIEAMEERQDEA